MVAVVDDVGVHDSLVVVVAARLNLGSEDPGLRGTEVNGVPLSTMNPVRLPATSSITKAVPVAW